jgi:hypothetical protein
MTNTSFLPLESKQGKPLLISNYATFSLISKNRFLQIMAFFGAFHQKFPGIMLLQPSRFPNFPSAVRKNPKKQVGLKKG